MMRYCPDPSVTAVRVFSVRAGLEASTVTPGSTAPDASLTVPARLAPPAWANASAGVSRSRNARVTRDFADTRIQTSLLCPLRGARSKCARGQVQTLTGPRGAGGETPKTKGSDHPGSEVAGSMGQAHT